MKTAVTRVIGAALLVLTGSDLLSSAEPAKSDDLDMPAILTAKSLKSAPGDTDQHKALVELYNHRQTLAAEHFKGTASGKATIEGLVECARRFQQAAMAVRPNPKDRVEFLKGMVELSEKIPSMIRGNTTEIATAIQLDMVRELKLEAELEIAKAKKEIGGDK